MEMSAQPRSFPVKRARDIGGNIDERPFDYSLAKSKHKARTRKVRAFLLRGPRHSRTESSLPAAAGQHTINCKWGSTIAIIIESRCRGAGSDISALGR